MRQLLLLRHAKAVSDGLGMPDHSRPLAERGRHAIAAMREAMRALDLTIDLALVSSARRTVQTFQGLTPFAEPERVEVMDALYLAPAADMLAVLRQVTPMMHRVLMIGHNPGIHELALRLPDLDPRHSDAPGADRLADGYPTSGLAVFETDSAWDALRPHGAKLLRFLTPADLAA